MRSHDSLTFSEGRHGSGGKGGTVCLWLTDSLPPPASTYTEISGRYTKTSGQGSEKEVVPVTVQYQSLPIGGGAPLYPKRE